MFRELFKKIQQPMLPAEDAEEVQAMRQEMLFANLTEKQWQHVHIYLKHRQAKSNEVVIQEGSPATTLFILVQGKVVVYKKGSAEHQDHIITILGENNCFGELALLDQKTRSASVKTLSDSSFLTLDRSDLVKLEHRDAGAYAVLLRNIAINVSQHLRESNVTSVKILEEKLILSRIQIALGTFITYTIFLLAIYSIILGITQKLTTYAATTTLISSPLLIFFAVLVLLMMKQSGLSWSTYGFTLNHWQWVVKDSLLWTLGFIGLISLLKIATLYYSNQSLHANFFSVINFSHDALSPLRLYSILIYIILVPLQEIIARGALQSSLRHFLPQTKNRETLAIIMAATVFSAMHAHLSILFVFITFIPGLFWGVLFARHNSILGVMISHILIGTWAFLFLGLDTLLLTW